MLKNLSYQKLSQLINHILASDPISLTQLKKLHGKCFQLNISKTPINLAIHFNTDGVSIQPFHENQIINVSLSGSPSALLRFAKTTAHTQMLMDKAITIHGDLDLLFELKKIQERLTIDWEGLLANHLGDFAANRLMLGLKHFKAKAQQHLTLAKKDTLDYTYYEAKLLPTKHEVESFYAELYTLRRDIERFEARLQHKRKPPC